MPAGEVLKAELVSSVEKALADMSKAVIPVAEAFAVAGAALAKGMITADNFSQVILPHAERVVAKPAETPRDERAEAFADKLKDDGW